MWDSSIRSTANSRAPLSLLSGNSFVWKLGIWVYHSREPGTSRVGLASLAQRHKEINLPLGKYFLALESLGCWGFLGFSGFLVVGFLVFLVFFWFCFGVVFFFLWWWWLALVFLIYLCIMLHFSEMQLHLRRMSTVSSCVIQILKLCEICHKVGKQCEKITCKYLLTKKKSTVKSGIKQCCSVSRNTESIYFALVVEQQPRSEKLKGTLKYWQMLHFDDFSKNLRQLRVSYMGPSSLLCYWLAVLTVSIY